MANKRHTITLQVGKHCRKTPSDHPSGWRRPAQSFPPIPVALSSAILHGTQGALDEVGAKLRHRFRLQSAKLRRPRSVIPPASGCAALRICILCIHCCYLQQSRRLTLKLEPKRLQLYITILGLLIVVLVLAVVAHVITSSSCGLVVAVFPTHNFQLPSSNFQLCF